MADRQPQPQQQRSSPRPTATTFLRRVREHSRNSTHLMGILTLLISGAILLLLTGLTMTVSILALIFFAPVILLTSPIWVPVAIALLVAGAGFVLFCGSGVAGAAALAWLYKYFKGSHPPGSDRVDYARSRLVDTASHVKDYAREYGGFLHSKVKDAAPGA